MRSPCTRLGDPEAAELGDLLVDVHPADEVGHPILDRPRRVPVRVDHVGRKLTAARRGRRLAPRPRRPADRVRSRSRRRGSRPVARPRAGTGAAPRRPARTRRWRPAPGGRARGPSGRTGRRGPAGTPRSGRRHRRARSGPVLRPVTAGSASSPSSRPQTTPSNAARARSWPGSCRCQPDDRARWRRDGSASVRRRGTARAPRRPRPASRAERQLVELVLGDAEPPRERRRSPWWR